MAEFDVKTISWSPKIKAKIEVNMGSLEGEYKGNKLNFERAFTIDSGKGSNYNAQIKICDHRIENKSCAYLSRPHRKAIYFVIHGIQRADIVINLSFDGKTKTLLCTNSNNKVEYKGVTLSNILDNLITEKIDKPLKMDITIEFEPGNLRTGISKENLFDVIKAATLTKDEEMMAKCAEFIRINHGTFNMEENPDWEDFFKENPECGSKILKLMMFKK